MLRSGGVPGRLPWEPFAFSTSGAPAPDRRCGALGCPAPLARSLQEAWEECKFSPPPPPRPPIPGACSHVKADQPLPSNFQSTASRPHVPLGVLHACVEHLLYTHALGWVRLDVAGLSVEFRAQALSTDQLYLLTLAPPLTSCATLGKLLCPL